MIVKLLVDQVDVNTLKITKRTFYLFTLCIKFFLLNEIMLFKVFYLS